MQRPAENFFSPGILRDSELRPLHRDSLVLFTLTKGRERERLLSRLTSLTCAIVRRRAHFQLVGHTRTNTNLVYVSAASALKISIYLPHLAIRIGVKASSHEGGLPTRSAWYLPTSCRAIWMYERIKRCKFYIYLYIFILFIYIYIYISKSHFAEIDRNFVHWIRTISISRMTRHDTTMFFTAFWQVPYKLTGASNGHREINKNTSGFPSFAPIAWFSFSSESDA